MHSTGEIILRIVGFIGIAIGLLALYGAMRMRRMTAVAHTWPTVTGTIVASELETHAADTVRRRPATYGAAVRYAYEVNGKAYESDQIQLGGSSETSQAGQFKRTVAKYPEGKKVKVYYDPNDPGMATLEPGATGGVFNMAALGAGFVVTGAVIVGLTTFWPK